MDMGTMRYLVLAVALIGCGPSGDPTPIAGQDRAVNFVWKVALNQTKVSPEVYWRRDHCNDSNGIYGTLPYCWFTYGDEEVAGVETISDQWIEVGAPSDGFTFSDTALAHELLHAAIGDTEHQGPAWEHIGNIEKELKELGL